MVAIMTILLERIAGEEIIIGHNVSVKVVSTTDERAILAITHPQETPCFKGEQVQAMPSLVPWYRKSGAGE